MAITTRGWGSQGGIITTQGFGGGVAVIIEVKAPRRPSAQIQWLINQLRIYSRCKTTTTDLEAGIATQTAVLDGLDSDLRACGQRIRALNSTLRYVARLKRL
ncbi:MAG: hypothetical protein GTN93_10425 [Anaerolineae bacterium]|nr:hypothetical protein [Anaerolineae bacterium]